MDIKKELKWVSDALRGYAQDDMNGELPSYEAIADIVDEINEEIAK